MVDVGDVYARSARLLGARTGVLGTVTVGASTTTAVLKGLIGTTGSNTAYAGWRLIFPDSADGSREVFVQTWVDSTGTATFANQTDAPALGERYILVNATDFTLNEFDLAWAECQRQTRPTYKQIIPITPNARMQNIAICNWLRGAGDVDAVFWNISPLMLDNEGFEKWWNGADAAPDSWTLSGTGASVSRVSGGLRTAYAARLTSGMGAAAELTQAIPLTLVQWLTRRIAAVYVPLRGATWASTSTASAARVGIRYTESGVTTTEWASYIAGDGVPHFPDLSLTPNANMTAFSLVLQVAAGGYSADFSFGGLMQNTTTFANSYQLRDQGSQFYMEAIPNENIRNLGTPNPYIEFDRWPNVPGQIVVYSRRPLPQLTSLTATIEEQYAEACKWGLLAWMLRPNKSNSDRSRFDRVMLDAQREWSRFLANLTNLPVQAPPYQVQVRGA